MLGPLRALARGEPVAVGGVCLVEAADAVKRRADRGARDRDLDVVGPVGAGEVARGLAQLALGLLVAAELGQDRAELAAVAGRVGVRGPAARGVHLQRAARLALGGLQVPAAVGEAAEVVVQGRQDGGRRPDPLVDGQRAGVVGGGVVEPAGELGDDAEHVVQRGAIGVVVAERALAQRERVFEHGARAGAIAVVEQRDPTQAPEVDAQAIERVALGQGGRERVGAVERPRGRAVVAELEQRVGAHAQHVRSVEVRLALLGDEGRRRLLAELRAASEITALEGGARLRRELQAVVLLVDAHGSLESAITTLAEDPLGVVRLQAVAPGARRDGGRDDDGVGHRFSPNRRYSQRMICGASRMRMTRTGTPAATAFEGTSLLTTVDVPSTLLSPTVTPRRIATP